MDKGPVLMDSQRQNGQVNVPTELDFLKRIRSSGADTTELEQLLFSDIIEYNRRKRQLMNYQLPNIENNPPQTERTNDFHQDLLLSIPNEYLSDQYGGGEEEVLDLSEKVSIGSSTTKGPPSTVFEGEKRQKDDETSPPNKNGPNVPSEDKIKKGRGSKLSRKRGMLFILVTISIIIFLIMGYSAYMLLDEDENDGPGPELISDFSISDSAPLSGTLVSLSAKFIEAGTTYQWMVFPENYAFRSGSAKESNIQFFFKKAGTYRVDLRVTFKGKTETTNKFISVSERTFVVSRERYSDKIGYNVSGNLFIENIDSILRTKDILSYKRMFLTYSTEANDPAISTTSDKLILSKDGLGKEYLNLERGSVQNLRFDGYLERPNGMRSPLIGSTNIEQRTLIDVYNKRPTKMVTSTRTDLQFQAIAGTTVDYRIIESGTIYNDLGSDLNELRVEDISEGRDMRVGMEGNTRWGNNDLYWEAVEVDIIGQRPALRLDLRMTSSDLKTLELKEFGLSLWLSSDLPLAVRSIINISSENDVATPYKLNHQQEMAFFEAGTEALIYGDINAKHDSFIRADEVFPEITSEFQNKWTYLPELGNMTSTIPSGFTAQDAISRFEESPEFKAYKRSNPSLYGVISNYSNFGNKEQWRFSLAEKGDKLAWNQSVRRTDQDIGFPDDVEPVDLDRTDIGTTLTYSGAEHCLKKLLPELEVQFSMLTFGTNSPSQSSKIGTTRCSLGTKVDMRYPMVGLINPGLIEKLPICYYLESFDGTFKVGLDMTNGQLSFATSTQVTKL